MGGNVSSHSGKLSLRKRLAGRSSKSKSSAVADSSNNGNGNNNNFRAGSPRSARHSGRNSRASGATDDHISDKFSVRSRRRSSTATAVAATLTVAARPPELRPQQRTLVRETWVMVEEHISEVSTRIPILFYSNNISASIFWRNFFLANLLVLLVHLL